MFTLLIACAHAPSALLSAPTRCLCCLHTTYATSFFLLNWQACRGRVDTPGPERTERSEPQGVAYSLGLCCVNEVRPRAQTQDGEECGKSTLVAATSECAGGWATSLSTSSYVFSQFGSRNTFFGLKCFFLGYAIYWPITSIQEHYSKKRPTHFSLFIPKFSISPGCCHILTVLLHAAWNSWAMWFLRFYFRAAAVKCAALFTVALGIVDKIKSFSPAVWLFQSVKSVSAQVRAFLPKQTRVVIIPFHGDFSTNNKIKYFLGNFNFQYF